MTDFETVDLYFKQVYTCKTKTYSVNYDYTMAQLYQFITAKAFSDDFGIDRSYRIEIVEAGQFDNANGHDAELAPALTPNAIITLREKYGENIKNVAFYIRPKLFITIPVINETTYDEDMRILAPRT
jgi:hypothetical protein